MRTNGLRISKGVQSIADLRWKNLTRQGWDKSCGAAVLSTILTYHHNRQFSEMAITLSILKNSDPLLVRERGGFSLFDLKRFIKAIGLDAVGYGEMTLGDLSKFEMPAILPVHIGNFDHFIVFKNLIGGHVVLGDPAFGNIVLTSKEFDEMWQSKIAFFVVTKEEKQVMSNFKKAKGISPLSTALMDVTIPNSSYSARLLNSGNSYPVIRRINHMKSVQ